MLRKLAFVIAGAQKGGTTTLDAICRWHPQIQMANTKETHFFDDEQQDWKSPDYRALDKFFTSQDDRLRGEATPITIYWRPAIRRLRDYNPDIKIVLLLRSPIDRTFSNWRKEYSIGRDVMSFDDAIRVGRDRVRIEGEIEGLHRYFAYVERSLYGQQLAYLINYFPRQQIHCELSEDFFADRAATLQRLSAFLGIDPFPEQIPPMHENPGRIFAYPSTLTAMDVAYLWALFKGDIAAVEAFLGRPIPEWRPPIVDRASREDLQAPHANNSCYSLKELDDNRFLWEQT
jgi:hypothetical protein